MESSNSKNKNSTSNKGDNQAQSKKIEGDYMEKNMRLFLRKFEKIQSDEVNYSEYKIKEIISLTIGKSLLMMN